MFVQTWHVMRDHPRHTRPVEPGFWGAKWSSGTADVMAALRNVALEKSQNYLSEKAVLDEIAVSYLTL